MPAPANIRPGRRIALHTCCGPCLLEPYDALASEGDEVVAVFFNPNIHPAEEYERRRDSLTTYAAEHGIQVVELPYDLGAWMEQVAPLARDQEQRCRACYRLRLTEVAKWAAERSLDAIATTLTVSPHQDPEAIAQEGRSAAAEAGIEYLSRDYRARFPEAARRSRELGMYRQNYCGCVISDLDAREQRRKRKAEKAARSGRESDSRL